MHGDAEPLLVRLERLLMLCDLLGLPLVRTLEHPIPEKGELPERLATLCPRRATRFVKRCFDALAEAPIRSAVSRLGRKMIAVAGGETDVCVLLTVMSLLENGYGVYVLEDCLYSSTPHIQPALDRMYGAGAIPSTLKTFSYELTHTVDRKQWPTQWQARVNDKGNLLPPPEDLPLRDIRSE
jgi:hypothetical protein